MSLVITSLEVGLLFGLVALGSFITFRVLHYPDLTVDGSLAPSSGDIRMAGTSIVRMPEPRLPGRRQSPVHRRRVFWTAMDKAYVYTHM